MMRSGALWRGFSLMEMMVVLLIVAIIAAASAPMVTKKMSRNAGSADSPWIFTGLSNSIAYNMGGNNNSIAIIGASSYDANGSGINSPRLVLSGGDGLAFANENGKFASRLFISSSTGTVAINSAQPSKSAQTGTHSTVIGISHDIKGAPTGVTALGNGVTIDGVNATALGYLTKASTGAVSIGHQAKASGAQSIAIGYKANVDVVEEDLLGGTIAIGHATSAKNSNAIAVGTATGATGENSTAIGPDAHADHYYSTAIGAAAKTENKNQIVLGTEHDTVYIKGNLVVGKNAYIGKDITHGTSLTPLHLKSPADGTIKQIKYHISGSTLYYGNPVSVPMSSDRRLKNVGKAYTAGLEDLKKLDFFHYTFKKDEAKTPRVGVMAQDLEKVFPDAVTKGDDGFLRIRWEDMFYAVINAVKELDAKISAVVKDITDVQDTIKTQQEQIDELEKQNAELEKRIEKLEKSLKKEKKIDSLIRA